jgi:transcriptional regulator with XRE-family HTH domain
MLNIDLARKSGVSESAIRSYLKGGSFPSIDKIEAIALACNAPMEWLITVE